MAVRSSRFVDMANTLEVNAGYFFQDKNAAIADADDAYELKDASSDR